VHMDLSAQDTVVVTGVFLECAHRLFECGGDGGASRYAAPRGLVPCGDGSIWIVVLEDHQWQGCVEAMGSPPWAESIRSAADRHDQNEMIQERVAAWASGLTAHEAADALQRRGVPATPVNSCADLLEGVGRDVRSTFFAEKGTERLPDLPFETIERRTGAVDAPTRSRYRLLDLTQVLVGPLATSWLGAMGIDVLKVEDPERVDIYRRSGPFLNDEPGLERSAYFSIANYSKRSHAVALQTGAGRERLAQLVASSDVVVHNLVNRAATLGITPSAAHDELGTFVVSCSGYARDTANGAYRAYGMNIQAAGGVVHLSRDRLGQPTNLGTSWADPLSSIWLAIMTLVQLLKPARERASIDVSMVEVVAHEFREYFQAQSIDGKEIGAGESRLDHAAPHGIYRTRGDDRWLALAVEDDAAWASLVTALGRPAELDRPGWEHLAGRLQDQDALDEALGRVLRERDADELFVLLQRASVACAPVWSASDLVGLEHLRMRRLLQPVTHPVWGERPLIGLPWLVDGVAVPITATPVLGSDTTDDPEAWWVA
jgi:crotonobetainyl-CoA:carnitine CoA-transferase CaiB-like acyl-CoA transferase